MPHALAVARAMTPTSTPPNAPADAETTPGCRTPPDHPRPQAQPPRRQRPIAPRPATPNPHPQGDRPPRSTTTAASARAESRHVAENPPSLHRVVGPQQVARNPLPTAESSTPAAIPAAPRDYRLFRPPADRAPSHSAAGPP